MCDVRTVHENRWFQCGVCDKKFAEKCDLKYHNDWVHLKQSNFKCNTCFMSFCRRAKLDAHESSCHQFNEDIERLVIVSQDCKDISWINV